jgi:hypothetical protein
VISCLNQLSSLPLLDKFAITQTFKIGQSSTVKTWLVAIHALAIFASVLNALALGYKIILIIFILTSLLVYLWKEAKFKGVSIRYSSLSGWEMAQKNSVYVPIQILPSTVITPYLIVLHLKTEGNKSPALLILICRDALIGDEFRRLMVALKISWARKV